MFRDDFITEDGRYGHFNGSHSARADIGEIDLKCLLILTEKHSTKLWNLFCHGSEEIIKRLRPVKRKLSMRCPEPKNNKQLEAHRYNTVHIFVEI